MRIKKEYTFRDIKYLLPYEYPFLFIDKATLIEEGKKIVCIKNVSGNEYYFAAHFKDEPIMPGVILIEAMAQATFLLERVSIKKSGMRGYLARIKDLRFFKAVYPGDQLTIEAEVKAKISNTELVEAKILCNAELVCQGELVFAMLPINKKK